MRYVSLQRDTKLSVEITNGDVIQELIAKCCFHVVDFRVKKKKNGEPWGLLADVFALFGQTRETVGRKVYY